MNRSYTRMSSPTLHEHAWSYENEVDGYPELVLQLLSETTFADLNFVRTNIVSEVIKKKIKKKEACKTTMTLNFKHSDS